MLIVLMSIYAANFMDRFALGLVLETIKRDLRLSDTELGLLSGIAFALFYSVLGGPIARWADRGNRVTIIALTTGRWSVMVALCGRAGSFVQLLLARGGVAVGEAGCVPPAHSLIADYFDRATRPRAVAIYMLGSSLSVVAGFLGAGWATQFYGWRATFIVMGLPGIALALLAWLTLREPRREKQDGTPGLSVSSADAPQPGFQEVMRTLWTNRTFRHLLFSFTLIYFFGYGLLQWQPTFFIRRYGLQTGELGTWFTLIYGGGGFVGTWLGGELASRFARNNERLQLRIMGIAVANFGVLSLFVYLVNDRHLAFFLLAMAVLGATATNGPLFAAIQTLVPASMRATAIAIIYLFANLIGMGLGPLAAGALSDALRPYVGDDSLRYALLILAPGYAWGGLHLWFGSATFAGDLPHEPEAGMRTASLRDTGPALS